MTEKKVTSYELSKKLAEAGFDYERHTGFYSVKYKRNYEVKHIDYSTSDITYHNNKSRFYKFLSNGRNALFAGHLLLFKAYLTCDLLEWLREQKYNCSFEFYLSKENSDLLGLGCNGKFIRASTTQEALGEAVLKILEEQKNEN